jgi:hypothetical protein
MSAGNEASTTMFYTAAAILVTVTHPRVTPLLLLRVFAGNKASTTMFYTAAAI